MQGSPWPNLPFLHSLQQQQTTTILLLLVLLATAASARRSPTRPKPVRKVSCAGLDAEEVLGRAMEIAEGLPPGSLLGGRQGADVRSGSMDPHTGFPGELLAVLRHREVRSDFLQVLLALGSGMCLPAAADQSEDEELPEDSQEEFRGE